MPRILDEETRQATRDHILRQAASEFARLGFEQANINTIAERAGIGKGTIYLYFSKHIVRCWARFWQPPRAGGKENDLRPPFPKPT